MEQDKNLGVGRIEEKQKTEAESNHKELCFDWGILFYLRCSNNNPKLNHMSGHQPRLLTGIKGGLYTDPGC